LVENRIEKRRTRKSKASSSVKSAEFPHASVDGKKFYKYPQLTSEFHFDCDGLRKMNPADALKLLIDGLVNQLVIADQREGRALSLDAFEKKYNDDVIIDVKSALEKKSKAVGSVDKVVKEASKLTSAEQLEAINVQLAKLGLPPVDKIEEK
jgi:hypothetical protein